MPNDTLFVVLLGAVVLATALAVRWLTPSARARRHRRKQDQARRVLARINAIELMPQRLAYLRKIDPLTFEELLLEAFERQGYRVTRNRSYSGDGGLDGIVERDGRRYLIQAKRYGKHIDPQHVAAFGRLIEQRGCHGIFCHTGRTGAGARSIGAGHPRLTILSGQRLLDFLTVTG